MTGRRRNPAVLASVSIAGAAFAILGIAIGLTSDDEGPPPVADVSATPTASAEPPPRPVVEPEPEPEPEPVSAVLGEVVVEDLSATSTGLYGSGHPGDGAVPTDQPAVDAFRDAIVAAVDAHLLDQQQGGDGTLATDAALPLADADRPVGTATIALRIGVRGTPEWARANVDVTLLDGATEHTELVFAPGEPPQVLAVSR
ncbi:MAG: hypothetical protein WD378_09220 [Egicoccus sp.]